MSFQEKYEKVILGVGITLAVAAGGWAYLQNTSLEQDFAISSPPAEKNSAIKGIEAAEALSATVLDDHSIPAPKVGAHIFTGFVGPALFNKVGSNIVVDIYDAAPAHLDIPNTWFIDNNIIDALVKSNGAEMDSDGDGFSNYEEFKANTKPNDASNFPNLIAKLQGVNIKAKRFALYYSAEPYAAGEPAEIQAIPYPVNPTNRPIWKASVKEGQEFGEGADTNRFKLVKLGTKQHKGMDSSYASIEDLKPEKNGATYEVFTQRSNAFLVNDLSATLSVSAGPRKGEFTVIEGATFTIPGDPTKATYVVEKIDERAKTLTFKEVGKDKTSTLTF